MAIYHCEVGTFSRAKGHSAVQAAAYRARTSLMEDSTGVVTNYSKHSGLVANFMVLPKGEMPPWAKDIQAFWNQVEKAEKRVNSTVARQFEIALPHELTDEQRLALTQEITENLVNRFGFGAMASIHKAEKDNKNEHVHILVSTRKITKDGFTEKTRELDMRGEAVEEVRKMVADTMNKHLEKAGIDARVDHRTLESQLQEAMEQQDIRKIIELDREPLPHVYRGKNQQKYEEKRQQAIERNQKRREKNIRQFISASAEDAQTRNQIIKQLKAKEGNTEEQIQSALKAYDQLCELVNNKGSSQALSKSLNQLDPLEKSIFFDLHKDSIRLPSDKIEKIQQLKERTLHEMEKLTALQTDTSQHLQAHKAEGQKEAGLLKWLVSEAQANGIRFEVKDQKPAAPEPFKPNAVLSGIENLISKVESRRATDPILTTSQEHQHLQQAKHQAASLPPPARAFVGNNLMGRVADAARSVRELEGQLRSCQPAQRATLLGRIRAADAELAAANRALDDAKAQALAEAARSMEQSRKLAPSFIPQTMANIHAKDSS